MRRCKRALPLPTMRMLGIPLPADQVEVLGTGMPWEEIQVGHRLFLLRLHSLLLVHLCKAGLKC